MPPIGASLEEAKPRQTVNNNNAAETPAKIADNKPTQQLKTPAKTTTPSTTTTTPTPVALSNESEQKLLQMISDESKANLYSIKDTLERLVLLAQGGETLPTNVQFELGNLKNAAAVTTPTTKTTAAAAAAVNNAVGGGEAVKTDVVDIPIPPGATLSAHQLAEENAKLIHLNNQYNEFYYEQQKLRQQEQEKMEKENAINEQLAAAQNAHHRQQQQRQTQQTVQTDMTFTPRPGSPTEERTLLARAQAIVENKAEELVTKYSQLIEQSEANRLAETVKKVEKRMKVCKFIFQF